MDFGDVIRSMKANPGKRFARKGWNGKGMFIYLTPGRQVDLDNWKGCPLTRREIERDGVLLNSHIDMYAADGTRVIGWLASQTDMLAEDWEEVSE